MSWEDEDQEFDFVEDTDSWKPTTDDEKIKRFLSGLGKLDELMSSAEDNAQAMLLLMDDLRTQFYELINDFDDEPDDDDPKLQ